MHLQDPSRPNSMPEQPWRKHIHVVLVEPGDSLNVGSVARAMSNLGFGNLHLVAPPRFDARVAAKTACWAQPMVESAHIHDSLEAALAPMQQVTGFTARHGRHRPRHMLLPQWSEAMRGSPLVDTALLFGPEDTGLRAEHITACRKLVRIPSTADNPSFNLSQAVLLTLFELTRQDWSETPQTQGPPPAREGDLQQLERLVDEVNYRSGFYGKGTPAPLPGLVHHMLRRIEPDTREMAVLLGLFDRANRTLSGGSPVQPMPGEKDGEEKRLEQP